MKIHVVQYCSGVYEKEETLALCAYADAETARRVVKRLREYGRGYTLDPSDFVAASELLSVLEEYHKHPRKPRDGVCLFWSEPVTLV